MDLRNSDKLAGGYTLDPHDVFERVLIEMAEVQRRKQADYAIDGNRWSNFEQACRQVVMPTEMGFEYMIATKQARLQALTRNGRDPLNESVMDTMVDRAVYSVLAIAYRNDVMATEVRRL